MKMVGRGSTLLVAAGLILSGCGGPADNIEIRPVGKLSTQARPADEQIAYARSQLALGSPGLGLEAFRKVLRVQPDNPLALAGIADCYAAMGRGDLARRYYEAALAVAPQDPVLLQSVSAPGAPEDLHLRPPAASAQDNGSGASFGGPAEPLHGEEGASGRHPPASTTVTLPPARLTRAIPIDAVQPRLERLSEGEVALVTTTKPLWQPVVVSRTRASTTVRWVPIRNATSEPQIRLLNAARRQGLAARTRLMLSTHGWRGLAIGDAPKARATSVVLYPFGYEAAGRSLATHLNIPARGTTRGHVIVVLLGRDAARLKSRQVRG